MDDLLNHMKKADNKTLEDLYQFTRSTCKIFYSYRFIFISFVDILKNIPEIESKYEGINFSRKEEFQLIFSGLQKNDIFQKDILADNWLTHNRLILKLDQQEAISHYTLLQMNLFYPLLNKEQQKLYEQRYIK